MDISDTLAPNSDQLDAIELVSGPRTFTIEKVTKGSGTDIISAPWINIIGCTTPHWIADNMPAATVGGGFTSRCVFVYADSKETLIALPDEHTRPDHEGYAAALTADLEHIATNLVGPYTILEEARAWIREWYAALWAPSNMQMDDKQLEGYRARKQTHMMKLALVLSASRGDSMEITLEDVVLANKMLEATEPNLDKVFSRIGRTEDSLQAERFIDFIKRHGKVRYVKAYQHIHSYFPDFRDFEGVLAGALKSGQISMYYEGNSTQVENTWLQYTGG